MVNTVDPDQQVVRVLALEAIEVVLDHITVVPDHDLVLTILEVDLALEVILVIEEGIDAVVSEDDIMTGEHTINLVSKIHEVIQEVEVAIIIVIRDTTIVNIEVVVAGRLIIIEVVDLVADFRGEVTEILEIVDMKEVVHVIAVGRTVVAKKENQRTL